EVISTTTRPNGLLVQKIRVPLGVLFFIYESRPNVTIDAAALAIKSGNAIILRGGKEAAHSNAALMECITLACRDAGLPEHAVQLVTDPDRTIVTRLLKEEKHIDLVIPRGGEGLIRTVVAESHVPVLKHYQGICHLYVDRQADPHIAVDILINGKCQRPGVCNALETLLVHDGIAPDFFSLAAPALAEHQVEVRGCPRTLQLLPKARLATDMDYATEYLALILSCKVVRNIDEAITHIQRYSSGHSEAIITNNEATAKRFTSEIDSAALFVNASTRFHDGYELGLGAEIGISTDKMHARGPCGLVELTSYKYVIVGSGHVRS
ncbi:MAG TPA: glutamate-5-semialdehyde dehydrogenase, partial [Gemmatales bacterium]|nr:glutamate-5-semialdehyde dehydrogenase [Gemmatales bacterium]